MHEVHEEASFCPNIAADLWGKSFIFQKIRQNHERVPNITCIFSSAVLFYLQTKTSNTPLEGYWASFLFTF